MACCLAQKLVMSQNHATTSGVILHAQMMASCMSHRYASNMIPFSLLFLDCGTDLSMRYLAPTSFGVVQKMTCFGSLHTMKAMRVINHE
jgi:hypothetical protein